MLFFSDIEAIIYEDSLMFTNDIAVKVVLCVDIIIKYIIKKCHILKWYKRRFKLNLKAAAKMNDKISASSQVATQAIFERI